MKNSILAADNLQHLSEEALELLSRQLQRNSLTEQQLQSQAAAAEHTQRVIKCAWGAMAVTAVVISAAYILPAAGSACAAAWRPAATLAAAVGHAYGY